MPGPSFKNCLTIEIINRSHVLPVTSKLHFKLFSQTKNLFFIPCLGYHWRLGKHVCSSDRSLILLRRVSLMKYIKINEDNMMSLPPKEHDANFLRNHHRTSQVVPEVMSYLPARNLSVCLY